MTKIFEHIFNHFPSSPGIKIAQNTMSFPIIKKSPLFFVVEGA
ncbi:MAG: hypothetical protein Q8N99_01085 [Nanoarchaeota archaeon]|nr:hypothetical protein [Nanoarchaeota archaeon]